MRAARPFAELAVGASSAFTRAVTEADVHNTATSEIVGRDPDRRTLTVRTTCRVADGTEVLTGESRIKPPRELA